MINTKTYIASFACFIFSCLHSLSNNDSLLYCWKLDEFLINKLSCNVDSSLDGFQTDDNNIIYSIANSHTGNLGGASISDVFLLRNNLNIHRELLPFSNNINIINPLLFFNTRFPVSHLFYSFYPGKKDLNEQVMNVMHSQNVNPYFNFGIEFNFLNSLGHFKRQKIKIGEATVSYSYIRNRYQLHNAFNISKIKTEHNGGINDSTFFNSDNSEDTKTFSVFLSNAYSEYKHRYALLSQKLYLGQNLDTSKKDYYPVFVAHSLDLSFLKRSYIDILNSSDPYSPSDSSYYDRIYFNNMETHDTSSCLILKNTVSMGLTEHFFKKSNSGLNIFLSNEYINQKSYTIADTVFIPLIKHSEFNNSVALSFTNANNILNIDFISEYFFTGYKKTNYRTYLTLSKNILPLDFKTKVYTTISRKKYSPLYFYNNYSSNHFIWFNEFTDIEEDNATFGINIGKWNLKTEVSYNKINNYIYTDSSIKPVQMSDAIDIATFMFSKKLDLRYFIFTNTFYYQYSKYYSILSIPEFCLLSSLYFNKNFIMPITKGELQLQAGVDLYYKSSFYYYNFMPATETFYLNQTNAYNEYFNYVPFINIRLKRAFLFVKYENMNSLLTNNKYFSLNNYPRNMSIIRFGIKWSFYD